MSLCKAIFNFDIAALHKSGFAETLSKSPDDMPRFRLEAAMEKPDYWSCRLLRNQHQRPSCCRRAAESGDELAPSHITPWNKAFRSIFSLAFSYRAAKEK